MAAGAPRVLIGVLIFIFLTPIMLVSGMVGGCFLAVIPGMENSAFFVGAGLGLLGSIAITALITRSIRLG
jgi:ABC-type transporter Mla maintaining outer membrane lipid asymmetry permease subunit MlaE